MIFYQIKLRTCVIPHFHVILTGKSFYGIMSVIQGDLQGQRVNFKFKCLKIILVANNKFQHTSSSDKYIILLFEEVLTGEFIYGIILVIQ